MDIFCTVSKLSQDSLRQFCTVLRQFKKKSITFHLVCFVFVVSTGSCTARKVETAAEDFGTQRVFFELYLGAALGSQKSWKRMTLDARASVIKKVATPPV